jgi:chemotaxis family two-component system sensor kinase Cph1
MNPQQYETKIHSLSTDLELMAYITSHDLRDPLRQAIINCEEIKKTAPSELLNETISSINEVIARIALLREYSYLANFDKEFESVDCNAVLQEALENLKDKISKYRVVITADNLPVVAGYQPHLLKLFTNLLDNAIKFNGTKINISCEEQQEFFQFKITDNGMGLEEVYRELVFALFQRLTLEIKDGSYGAGLAFCKKIVKNHQGKIWYKSDGENGTSFYFTLLKHQ